MAKPSKKENLEPGMTLIATNRRASFDYELGERFEAGLVLLGSEVKSLRSRAVGISEAWASIVQGEAYIEGMRISILDHAAYGHTQERRSRKLLLHRKEILALEKAIDRGGMTVVATRLYFRNGKAKIELAIARGKRKTDKREAIKDRDAAREAQILMREKNR
ncbi:MAG TPA: SsrA-binding protein SmpB [Polyangiaceae bacterium]|jgi:SsrA-binding protein|nr:MAG: SsrA-binding protein [Deltaproteobacteria bacterium ADurb.Bin207]HPB95287.1 SsrA-binding protein SmpB [Polyangiaceae bacterium]HPY19743.1 SsrA-binding protein SmpB [Polyangiaceae bacterium]HQF23436.1 SsrA-binding protein SmpB [Polyangiaceae bacterium]HQK18228.1 SsrA-binding protein SmpB [Polyangiaceae bacterium]